MKKITLIIMAFALAFYACNRDYIIKTKYNQADSSVAYLKIVHAAPFLRQTLGGVRDSFNVFINNVKVNGTFLTYNSIFPFAVNPNTNTITNTYIAVQPGTDEIKLSIPGTATPDSFSIMKLTKNLEAGKLYTLMITDSVMSARDSSKILVQDSYTAPIQGYVNIRFINAVLNDTIGKTVDLYSYAKNTTILTAVKPGGISSFQLLGYNLQTVDTFYVTRSLATGVPSSTPLSSRLILAKLAFTTTANGAANQRSFTFYYKGDANVTSGTRARTVASYIHQ